MITLLLLLLLLLLCRSIEFADEYEKKKAEMVKAHEETNFSYQKKRVSEGRARLMCRYIHVAAVVHMCCLCVLCTRRE